MPDVLEPQPVHGGARSVVVGKLLNGALGGREGQVKHTSVYM